MPDNSLQHAQELLLEPNNLFERDLSSSFDHIMLHDVDYADLYFQYSRSEAWSLEEGIVKSGSFNIGQGVGVRALSGEKTAFAYSDEISLPALSDASAAVRAIASAGHHAKSPALRALPISKTLYAPVDPIAILSSEAKVKLLERVEQLARAADQRVIQVMASLTGEHNVVLIAGSDGRLAADIRPLVRLSVTVIMQEGKRREQGNSGGGGRCDYAYFDEALMERYVQEAVHQASVNLQAEDTPAGEMTVVLGPGWPGILLHEAIGHGLEGDFNRKGSSAFSGRIGERVAAPGVTVFDDGTIPDRRGSLNIDDEGNSTQRTVLIEDGILKAYLQDSLNARLMGTASTGNGRRESFAHTTIPRMTNTAMMNGRHDPQEIIQSVKKGIYAVNFGGGQVDITSGKFVFSMSEAYLIENGKPGRPVKGATLIGNGPDILTRVTMIGNDMRLDPGVGTCGKDGQGVPVGVGQPTLCIDGLTVGGTA